MGLVVKTVIDENLIEMRRYGTLLVSVLCKQLQFAHKCLFFLITEKGVIIRYFQQRALFLLCT